MSLTTGLLGAYTTFSTFSLETVRMVEDGAIGRDGLITIERVHVRTYRGSPGDRAQRNTT